MAERYRIKYEEKLQKFSLKRKYDVDIENCLPQELDKEHFQNFQTSLVLLIPKCTCHRVITCTNHQFDTSDVLGI